MRLRPKRPNSAAAGLSGAEKSGVHGSFAASGKPLMATGGAMIFAAYQARHDGKDFSFEGRDEAEGVLGVFKLSEALPVVTAHTLEQLEREARAHLGQEPDALLYLTDGHGRVYRIMINEKHHAATQKAEGRTAISVALLVFSVTCLLGASLGSLGAWPLLGFVCVTALYALILRSGFFNEFEGALVCEILLILALLLIPALQRVRASPPNGAPPKIHGFGALIPWRVSLARGSR